MRSLTCDCREKLLCLTAASGVIPNLEVAIATAGIPLPSKAYEAAAGSLQREMCTWLRQREVGPYNALGLAARAGDMAMCQWLLENGCWWHQGATDGAALGGHVELLEWLLQKQGFCCNADRDLARLVKAVAQGCALPVLQRLHAEATNNNTRPVKRFSMWLTYLNCDYPKVLGGAAASPTPDWRAKVEWLESQGFPSDTPKACKYAASRPDALERLTWLRQRGYPANAKAVRAAARAGNVDAVQYLLAEGVAAGPEAARAAAWNGHAEVLVALLAAGCGVDVDAAARLAARRGHLAALAWLVEAPEAAAGAAAARLDGALFAEAARSGSVELLGWLRGRGCEWDPRAYWGAAEGGSEEAMEWLAEQGCPKELGEGGDPRIALAGKPYLEAARRDDWPVLRCARRLGLPWGRGGTTFAIAVQYGVRPAVLGWMLDAGCPVDWESQETYQLKWVCNEDVLGWLRQQREMRQRVALSPGAL